MPHSIARVVSRPKCWAAACTVAALVGLPAAQADETHAKALFKAMSDYLAAHKSLSFEYDSNLEVVTADEQKLALASSGSVTLSRPDKIHATRSGGFANVEMVFDGKTLTMLNKDANVYAQAEVPGTIDHLVDELREKFHRPLPAADLLMSDVQSELMPLVTDTKDLGSGVIRGKECDHLAFRTDEVDWQIWIAQGDAPYPCRFVVTTRKVAGFPQYTIDVREWKANTTESSADFSFKPPAGATEIKPGELGEFDELPSIYLPK